MDNSGTWWIVKVYDRESSTTTTLSKFGTLNDIREDLNEEGYWEFVSAYTEDEE